MKNVLTLTTTAFAFLLLSACAADTGASTTLETERENPLYAEAYARTVVDFLVEFHIQNSKTLEDPAKAKVIDRARDSWHKEVDSVRELKKKGTSGMLIGLLEDVNGEVLYVNDRLYFSPYFRVSPSPFLHVYMTNVVDPRDAESFPDATSKDLGPVQTIFGAHSYSVPHSTETLRTVVLYDPILERVHGFAQLK